MKNVLILVICCTLLLAGVLCASTTPIPANLHGAVGHCG